jgi:transcriptional regulator with XRE-family HTH domain
MFFEENSAASTVPQNDEFYCLIVAPCLALLLLFSCYTTHVDTAFAKEASYVRELGHLSVRDIAHATGAAVSTVGAWMRHSRMPTGEHAERLAELSALVERLSRVIEPEYIPVWLHKPIGALGDDKPLDVLAEGDYRRLSRLISELESPTFS